MTSAADARRRVHELALDDPVAKVVAAAPPLSDAQREQLRAILRTANAQTTGPVQEPVAADTHHANDVDV